MVIVWFCSFCLLALVAAVASLLPLQVRSAYCCGCIAKVASLLDEEAVAATVVPCR